MRSITLADHAGFCFGVTNAVNTAYKELEKSVPLYCIGQLIHNGEVTSELENKGLVTIGSIEEAPDGSRVMIRAHGEPDSTYRSAAEKGVTLIDATCPFVKRIHTIAREAGKKGRSFIVIGDSEHPEVKGILGSTEKALGAVQTLEDALVMSEKCTNIPLSIAAQTTMTRRRFEDICAVFKQRCSDLEVHDTICMATKERQDSAGKLASLSDCMIVIGDRNSSNSRKLYEICGEKCPDTFFIERFSDLDLHKLAKYNKIGVAAGASAPERIIKEVIANMSEEFTKDQQNEEMNEMAAFMDEIEKSLKLPGRGEVVTGKVVQVTKDYVVMNLGCKKDGMLPKEETAREEGQELTDLFKEGDEVQAKVIKTDDGDGNILLSNKRIQSGENWEEINSYVNSSETVNVTVVKEVKGGVIANYKEVSGFIPMSQLADHYVETAAEYIGKTLPVKVTRVDPKRNKAVFSHKQFLVEEKNKKIAEIWQTLNVGDVVEGKVMRFTDYGAFVDIGGIDGLLHISEISWGKLKHPQEALQIGQIVNVKILNMNAEKGKISLGMKQNQPEPWSVIDEKYHEGDVITGKVVQIKEYGAFVELAPGLDGLVHISEVAHKRVAKISDELSIGQIVNAKILEIDKERKRISLSIKATIDPQIYEDKTEAEPAETAEEAPAEAPAEE
ncbi:MAG: bifunctional 4-hydroxy-3-methylbut-2-enyl diphosphate reductase/30S ribosomal protein S1 [Firmicutes bacterium]|nr:bifunctional 4-hydroxy-3-methylbut-2-enyl diphosphate reductase/30S ribosomal protein S1 [Bacillota bacterium]